jgi:hypothetical protein
MIRRIRLVTESAPSLTIELHDRNPETVKKVLEALPIESRAQLWGEELYFETPVEVKLENPQIVVEVGDVAYWPPEKCICIFFGKTPISTGNEIRAYSKVNVFGRVMEDPKVLTVVEEGERVKLEPYGL